MRQALIDIDGQGDGHELRFERFTHGAAEHLEHVGPRIALQASGEPIRSPIDGSPHRVRLSLPNGFEFLEAEVASGSYQTHSALKLQSQDSHSHLAQVHFTGHGIEP